MGRQKDVDYLNKFHWAMDIFFWGCPPGCPRYTLESVEKLSDEEFERLVINAMWADTVTFALKNVPITKRKL